MTCKAKHTMYQPLDEEWACPKCGETKEFVVDVRSDGYGEECGLLHNDDDLYCYTCDYRVTGKQFAKKLQNKNKLTTCPCCKGRGLVGKDHPSIKGGAK